MKTEVNLFTVLANRITRYCC